MDGPKPTIDFKANLQASRNSFHQRAKSMFNSGFDATGMSGVKASNISPTNNGHI